MPPISLLGRMGCFRRGGRFLSFFIGKEWWLVAMIMRIICGKWGLDEFSHCNYNHFFSVASGLAWIGGGWNLLGQFIFPFRIAMIPLLDSGEFASHLPLEPCLLLWLRNYKLTIYRRWMAKGARLLPQMGDIYHKVNKASSLPMCLLGGGR